MFPGLRPSYGVAYLKSVNRMQFPGDIAVYSKNTADKNIFRVFMIALVGCQCLLLNVADAIGQSCVVFCRQLSQLHE
jgi:hypothetical protein